VGYARILAPFYTEAALKLLCDSVPRFKRCRVGARNDGLGLGGYVGD